MSVSKGATPLISALNAPPAQEFLAGAKTCVRSVGDAPDTGPGRATRRTLKLSATGSTAGLVWVLGHDGRAAPVPVTLGITDGASTEIVVGGLSVGQAVLVGVEAGAPAATPPPAGPRLRI